MLQNDNSEFQPYSWRADIDSLAFYPSQHGGVCVVHRLAFRALLGFAPAPQDCANYFAAHREIFAAAAAAKIFRRKIASDANLHLTSRDVRRELLVEK